MPNYTDNVLNKDYILCPAIKSVHSTQEIFLITDDQIVFNTQKINFPDQNIFFLDILDKHSIKSCLVAIQEFHSRSDLNLNIVYLSNTSKTTLSNWEQHAEFSYVLLSHLQAIPCHFLLIANSGNTLAALIHGGALSLTQELSTFHYSYLSTEEYESLSIPLLFSTCFESDFQQYKYINKNIFRIVWKQNEKNNISNFHAKSILITGGSGAIGKIVSRYLVKQYSAHVFIVGRRKLDDGLVQELKETGAKAYFQGDCTDYVTMASIVDTITEKYGKIDAFFHLAGEINDELLRTKSLAQYKSTLKQKVSGSLVLEKLAKEFDVNSIVLFSSLSSIVGNVGQVDYAGANAFLNALTDCYQRQNNNRTKWLSINWGLWQTQNGMQMIESTEIKAMPQEFALVALQHILDNQIPISVVYTGNDNLIGNSRPNSNVTTPAKSELISLDLIIGWVREVIIKYTKLRNIDPHDELLQMGVDSIIAINISSHFSDTLSSEAKAISIPKTLLFQYGTIHSIAEYLAAQFPNELNKIIPFSSSKQQKEELSLLNPQPLTHDHNYREDDIAIIGIAGEFPDADNILEFWELLSSARSAIKEIPKNRWHWQHYFSLDNLSNGLSYSRQGGFINNADIFDAKFFKIPPVEAEKMDPQARRLLHQTYVALSDSQFFDTPQQDVGVFTAAMYNHYQSLDNAHELINNSFSAIANHISYYFNFTGPSIAVDTMCSGSLTALHLAINSLKLRECSVAIVGGVNIMCHPGKFQFLSKEKFLSPTGHCHSFGISADGYVPGEGAISLVLKPLKNALDDNNKIYAVIRGSALNSAGHGSAFTVPSAKAQASVISKAISQAGIHPDSISYIEAHGTGTALGDPIEIEGINSAYGTNTNRFCRIGSVKSNIGHLESAAGLASVVKVVLQMHFKKYAPSLNCTIENPHLPLSQSRLKIQKKLEDWYDDEIVYAGISGFGAGGSNAHIIMQSPPSSHKPEVIKIPNILFQSQSYWAGAFKFSQPLMTASNDTSVTINPILFQPNIKECELPLNQQNHINGLLILNENQSLFNIENLSLPHLIINTTSDWEEKIKNKFDSILQNTTYIFNLSTIDENPDFNTVLALHFKLAKLFIQVKGNIHYIHFVPEIRSDTNSVKIKSIFALFRTLSIEKSNFKMTLLESDHPTPMLIEKMNFLLSTQNDYRHLLYKNQRWYQRYYTELQSPPMQNTSLIKQKGVYLIAGGLGAIGLAISQMLLQKYQATIIILGRSELIGDKLDKFNMLSSFGANVDYLQIDITEKNSVTNGIKQILQKYHQLNGVIHSACVLNDGLFDEKSYSDFNAVIQSKMDGAIYLDEATSHITLDFFVMFSSISSVFGNVGQADYCVANTFLDEFAKLRTTLTHSGLRAGSTISINWPIWQVEGLSIDQATIDFIAEMTGLTPLSTEQGLALFERLINTEIPSQVIPFLGNKEKLKEKINITIAPEISHTPIRTNGSIHERLINVVSNITKMNNTDIELGLSINDIGMSSVLLAELAIAIQTEFNINIAPSVFFTYTTIEKIANYISTKSQLVIEKPIPAFITNNKKAMLKDEDEYAIIGMDAYLPGGPDIETFWKNILNNQSFIKKMDRWKQQNYFAATLPNIDKFDPKFFNLSNREAMLMDPQHRMFLSTAYNAILNSGYTSSQLSNVGVFIGVQFNDYQGLLQQRNKSNHVYAATGNAHAMLANRISYIFDFNGPSQTIDTACSSTLVAINRGLLALKNRECDYVLTGAVSLLIDPAITEAANSMGILSPNFRCATFDEAADGYVRGEGLGCFIIKRLADARRDKDPIHAIITSFAENHGGRANTLTSPNPIAQKELLLKAYTTELASQVSYIETHGTGTKLGDPVEIDALTQAFSILNPNLPARSIYLGAVKTNIGHLEPAAGIPSIVKVIYSMKNKVIPANINYKSLNSYINLDETPFTLVTSNVPWISNNPLIAGISSFGFGGSNAHIVLKENTESSDILSEIKDDFIFTLSARTAESLQKMRLTLANYLQEHEDLSLRSISYTLNVGRDHFPHRFAIITNNKAEMINALKDLNNPCVAPPTDFRAEQYTPANIRDAIKFYLQGHQINWPSLYTQSTPRKSHLPGYCFDTQSYWCDVESTTEIAMDI